jgi:signal peptidase I
VWLGDSIIREYTFKMNYYFMAGDYVFDSVDSRYWGLVPEDHIVGKAIFVWKSKDMATGKYRWKRFFKRL